MATAAPPRPTDTTAAIDAEFELLIREARRRARRRRAILVAIIVATVAAVATGLAVFATSPTPEAPPPRAQLSGSEDSAAAPVAAQGAELVASMYIHNFFFGRDVWLYLYEDGRLVQNAGMKWQQQVLTEDGVTAVRDMMLGGGLFDEAPPVRSVLDEGCCGFIQLRIDGDLIYVPHSWEVYGGLVDARGIPERYRVSPQFDVVADQLTTMDQWMPDPLWSDPRPQRYEPESVAVCAGATDMNWTEPLSYSHDEVETLLPSAAASILRAAPRVPEASVGQDRLYVEILPNLESPCRHLSSAQAQALAQTLVPHGWVQSSDSYDRVFTHRYLDGQLYVTLIPMLPHGVPANTYG